MLEVPLERECGSHFSYSPWKPSENILKMSKKMKNEKEGKEKKLDEENKTYKEEEEKVCAMERYIY